MSRQITRSGSSDYPRLGKSGAKERVPAKTLSGHIIWSQGFSESDGGYDLANIRLFSINLIRYQEI
jgi:hypothetical protein